MKKVQNIVKVDLPDTNVRKKRKANNHEIRQSKTGEEKGIINATIFQSRVEITVPSGKCKRIYIKQNFFITQNQEKCQNSIKIRLLIKPQINTPLTLINTIK